MSYCVELESFLGFHLARIISRVSFDKKRGENGTRSLKINTESICFRSQLYCFQTFVSEVSCTVFRHLFQKSAVLFSDICFRSQLCCFQTFVSEVSGTVFRHLFQKSAVLFSDICFRSQLYCFQTSVSEVSCTVFRHLFQKSAVLFSDILVTSFTPVISYFLIWILPEQVCFYCH